MPAENRDIRGNEINPYAVRVDKEPADPKDVARLADIGNGTVTTTSTDYQAANNDNVLATDAATITLPEPSDGGFVSVKSITSASVEIVPNGAESVEQNDGIRLNDTLETVRLISDGTDWFVISAEGSYRVGLVNTIDSFEDGDISEYGGDTANYTTNTSVVKDGSYSLNTTSFDGTGSVSITSTAGLNAYPQAGDTFHYHTNLVSGFTSSSSSNYFLRWGCQSETSLDGYGVHYETNAGNMSLVIWESGSKSTLSSTSITHPETEWVRTKIEWGSDGTITATAYDSTGTQLASTSTTDGTYTSGGVGYSKSEDQ